MFQTFLTESDDQDDFSIETGSAKKKKIRFWNFLHCQRIRDEGIPIV